MNRHAWIACGIAALAAKLAIALTTIGTNDVITWHRFADSMNIEGALWLYRADPMFNHPPFVTRLLSVLNWLVHHTALGFPFWVRVPAILADLGSLFLVALILRPAPRMLVLLALCPVSIFVSGFHGNTDPVMTFLLLLSIYFLESRTGASGPRRDFHKKLASRFGPSRPLCGVFLKGVDRPVLSAIAFGLAVCIKIVPLALAPAFLFYIQTVRRRLLFAGVAAATFVILSLPYIVEDPRVIARNVFGYRSLPGSWGFSQIARWLDTITRHDGFMAAAGSISAAAILVGIPGLMFFLARRPVSLFDRCALSIFLLLWLTPGFGVQYLAWLVPFALSFGEAWTIAVYTSTSVFQFLVYTYWSQEFPWKYADAFTMGMWPDRVIVFEWIAWLTIGTAVFAYLRRAVRAAPGYGLASAGSERASSAWR